MKKILETIKNAILPYKNIEFFDFSHFLSNDYTEMTEMKKTLDDPVLFGRPVTLINVRSRPLGTCSIEFSYDFFDNEFISETNRRISEKMGSPQYYDDSGRKIWMSNGITVINGGVETQYNVVIHKIVICFYKPLIRKYSHERLDTLNTVTKNVALRWKIDKYNSFAARGRIFLMYFETEKYQYTFSIKGKKLEMRSFRKELEKGYEVPDYYTYNLEWCQKTTVKSINDVESSVESFLLYMEEYDRSLLKLE